MAAFQSKVARTDLASTLRSASHKSLMAAFVGGEVPARLDDLAQLHVQALDGVGRVNHAPDVRREDEERRDVLPGSLPGSDDHRVLCPPWSLGKRL